MQVERINSEAFVANQLPDGSKILMDNGTETVFALNATAAAAWDACSAPTTLSRMTGEMQRSFHADVTEDLALEAVAQLRDKKLVLASGLPAKTTRREMIATLGALAVPLVVSLTMTEQRAHAQSAASKPKPTPCAAAVPSCKL